MSLYEDDSTHEDGTEITSGNKINFGGASMKGVPSEVYTLHLWNDKNGEAGSDDAVGPRISVVNGITDMGIIYAGTDINGNVSMLEARSCGAVGVAADNDSAWTPISPTAMLQVGDIPSDCMRVIELRMNVPQDATNLALAEFTLRVHV